MVSAKEQQNLDKIQNAYAIWFTTVRDDGMPQPTPVWFIWQDESFLIYTTPDSQKVKNLEQNPKVAVGYATDTEANSYVVVMGEGMIDPNAPTPNQNPAYMEKYRQGFIDIGMTPESFVQQFTVAIRVQPQHIRGE